MSSKENFFFSYDDGAGFSVSYGKTAEDEFFTWPVVLARVVEVLQKAYGYDMMKDIRVKGKPLEAYSDFNEHEYEQLEFDFEASPGLSD